MPRPGRMWRHYITIEKDSGTKNEGGQHIPDWDGHVHISNVPSERKQVAGGEIVRGVQMRSDTTHVFECHWFDGVTTTMRIKDADGTVYGITDARDFWDRGNRFLMIQAKT